ncbi:MAG: DUF4157 domain-containing protein [Dehalococcoidia bacterium]
MSRRLPEDVMDLLSKYLPGEDLARMRVILERPLSLIPRLLGAGATTFGRYVVFASGTYSPETARGLGLIAHEAMHVGQFRETGTLRFFLRYARFRISTRSRGMRHPLEAPCIELQRRVVRELREQGWP